MLTKNSTVELTNSELKPYKLSLLQKVYVGIKLIIDFVLALIGVTVCLVPSFIIAIAIKLDSKGPVFFKHKRIGKNGKEFTFLKFRSMSINAKPEVSARDYVDVDSYVTKVGSFLRKTSLDELPQLLLVLTGKMSLVGYRPSLKSEPELNDEREKLTVTQIRPGITGWAQVNGRDILAADQKKKAHYDYYYLTHLSLYLDIKILLLTVLKVLKRSDIKDGTIDNNIDNHQST